MKNQAKEHAAEDKKKKESVEVRNQADNLVFQTKKQIEEMKDKIPAESKTKLEAEIVKVEEALKSLVKTSSLNAKKFNFFKSDFLCFIFIKSIKP